MNRQRLILVLVFVALPLAFWPGSASHVAAAWLVVFVGVGALLASASLAVLRGRPLALPTGPESGPWAGLLLVIALSGAFGADPARLVSTWIAAATWVVVLGAVTVNLETPAHVRRLLAGLAAGAALASAVGLGQMLGLLSGGEPGPGLPSGRATFVGEDQIAGYAAVAVWPTLALALLTPLGRRRTVVGLAMLAMVAIVFGAEATSPRLAMVGAAAVVVPCRLLVRLGRGRWVPGVVAVALVLGAAAVALVFARILAPGTAGELPVPGVVADWLAANDGDVRRTDWLVAWHIFTQQLPAFAGAGSYQTLWPEARAALSALPDYAPLAEQVPVAIRARNDYLQGLAELGLMGAAWFLALAGALVHALHRRWSRLDGAAQTAFLALVGGVLTVALQALVSSPLHLPAPAFALAGILGVLASGALESGAPPRPRVRLPRVLAAVVLVAGVAVAAAGGREFAGDLAVARGVRLYREGRLSAALVEFERGARRQLWPGDGDLYRGLTLAALGRDDEAAAALTASLRHRPRYAGLLGLAELELGRGEFASALARLARVENCRPAAPFRQRVRYLRGMVFLRQERLAAARREFQRLFESAPRDPEGLVAMGELELRAGDPAAARDRYALALAAIEADLQAGPDPLAAAKLERLRDAAQRGLAGTR